MKPSNNISYGKLEIRESFNLTSLLRGGKNQKQKNMELADLQIKPKIEKELHKTCGMDFYFYFYNLVCYTIFAKL